MKPKPLDTLIKLATETRDSASMLLAAEQRDYTHINTQIGQLTEYRREYHRQLQDISSQGIELSTFREYQRFLSSLDKIIASAMHELDKHKERVNQSQIMWQKEQCKLTSYDTLSDRRNTIKVREDNRREQRQHDDMTVNTIARKWMQETS
ncbi:MAG: flagellar export protein FliJ [Porticoccus sp.]|nr:flagellar export protein FliJ [Porticoccus sp.]MBQ0807735.1 flagellar export protein FliJ [Porticoccus sp.]